VTLSVAMSEYPPFLVVGTHGHGLLVLDELGAVEWTRLADLEGIHADVSRDGSLIIAVARENGRIYAYDRNGNLRWSYDTGQPIATSWEAERWLIDTSASGDTTTAVLDDGYVVTLDREGNALWTLDFREEQPFTEIICPWEGTEDWMIECIQSMDVSEDGTTVVIGTWESESDAAEVFSFHRDGTLRWQKSDTRAESVALPRNAQWTVVDAEVVYCFDNEGSQLWRWPDPADQWSLSWSDNWLKHVAISQDGQRIYGSAGYGVAAFDPDGNVLWTSTMPDPFVQAKWIKTDTIGRHLAVAYLNPGSVFLFNDCGRLLWYWISLEETWVTKLAMSNDGQKLLAATSFDPVGVLFWDLAPPVADFTATPRAGLRPLQVRFTNESSGAIDSQVWDFGDGSSSTLHESTHTYNSTGTFTVTLTVSGPNGSDGAIRPNYITVLEAVHHLHVPLVIRG